MKNLSIIISTIAIVLATTSLIVSFKNPAPRVAGKAAVFTQADLTNLLNENPKIVADAMEAYQAKQQEEADRAANEALEKYAEEINSTANVPFVGNPDAKITMVEFFDFSCGYCIRLAPHLEKAIANNPDVKFIFKPLTFLGAMSVYKAKAALAANKQGKFLEFYSKAMEGDLNDEASIDAMAKEIGIDMNAYSNDMTSPEVQNALDEVSNLAQNVHVNGVPTLILNGKRVNTYDTKAIQDAIDELK